MIVSLSLILQAQRPKSLAFILSAIFIFAAGAVALAQTPANLNYEGETVTAIDLASRPEGDVEFLRSLIIQQPGQPYSNAKVQQSIAALQATGEFTAVRVTGFSRDRRPAADLCYGARLLPGLGAVSWRNAHV